MEKAHELTTYCRAPVFCVCIVSGTRTVVGESYQGFVRQVRTMAEDLRRLEERLARVERLLERYSTNPSTYGVCHRC